MTVIYLWVLLFILLIVSGILGYQLVRKPIGILIFQIFVFLIALVFLLAIFEYTSFL